MNVINRIVFVSETDTDIGPMAVTILEKLLDLKERKLIVESRGLIVLFPEPCNSKAIAVARERLMDMPSHFSRQLTESDFAEDTVVLTVNKDEKDRIYRDFENAINVFTVSEYGRVPEKEIPNPVGKDEDEYRLCFDELYSIIFKVATKLKEADKKE